MAGAHTCQRKTWDVLLLHVPTTTFLLHTDRHNRANPRRSPARFSPPKRAITSMMIHVPRRPTEGLTPARIANATAVGTAVSPVVIPASHSTRLFVAQRMTLLKELSRQLYGVGQPQEAAQLYGSSSTRCSCHPITQNDQRAAKTVGLFKSVLD